MTFYNGYELKPQSTLVQADLSGISTRGVNLNGSKLCGINFHRCTINAWSMTNCDLANANFVDGNINNSSFQYSKLMGADFSGANLCECNFLDADLTDVSFYRTSITGCLGIIVLGEPDRWLAFAWYKEYLRLRVGCREMSYPEAIEYWTGKRNRMEVLAAVKYAGEVAKIRGWNLEPVSGDETKIK